MQAESVDEMRDHLRELIAELPEERLAAMLQLVRMVCDDQEFLDWQGVALASLEAAYGDDEPEYTLADIRR